MLLAQLLPELAADAVATLARLYGYYLSSVDQRSYFQCREIVTYLGIIRLAYWRDVARPSTRSTRQISFNLEFDVTEWKSFREIGVFLFHKQLCGRLDFRHLLDQRQS